MKKTLKTRIRSVIGCRKGNSTYGFSSSTEALRSMLETRISIS